MVGHWLETLLRLPRRPGHYLPVNGHDMMRPPSSHFVAHPGVLHPWRLLVVTVAVLLVLGLLAAHGTQAQTVQGFSALSVTPACDALDVTWTPASGADATGYLVQWKTGGQEYSDVERRHTTGSTDSSYRITNLEAGDYEVRVTVQGGRSQGFEATKRANPKDTQHVTVVRGGAGQTYRIRMNEQPPIRVAVYPRQDLTDEYAYLQWDSGEALSAWPPLHFFIRNDPTTEELAELHPPAKWDTCREFSIKAKDSSATGTVTLYHGLIWDDLTERDGFTVDSVTVTVVDPIGGL